MTVTVTVSKEPKKPKHTLLSFDDRWTPVRQAEAERNLRVPATGHVWLPGVRR
jgi:hypothetical protein